MQDFARTLESRYEKYVRKFGVLNNSYIPREAGEEISLLTELVYMNQVTDLFPQMT